MRFTICLTGATSFLALLDGSHLGAAAALAAGTFAVVAQAQKRSDPKPVRVRSDR